MASAHPVFWRGARAGLVAAVLAACACAGQCNWTADSVHGWCVTGQDEADESPLSLLQVHVKLRQPPIEDKDSSDTPPSPPPPVTAVPRASSDRALQPDTPTTTGDVRLVLWFLLVLLLLLGLVLVVLSILGHIHFRCPRVNWHHVCFCCLGAPGDSDAAWRDSPGADVVEEQAGDECRGEDMYGFALLSLIRESFHISQKDGVLLYRVSHITIAILLMFTAIALQAFLAAEMCKFQDAGAVATARVAYDKYELHMYGGIESNTYLNKNVQHRGRQRFFGPANFDTLSEDLKVQICGIPFAEPAFFLAVTFLWSLSCTAELKKTVDLFFALIVHTPTVPSMAQALVKKGAADKDSQRLIHGLTTVIKVAITYCILLPRLAISAFLLLLGCRYLAATLSSSELVLNVVVLEFVLHLSRLCYIPIASARNSADFRDLRLRSVGRESRNAGCTALLGPVLWGAAAMVWCAAYAFELQQVLPDFKWDVHGPCKRYFKDTNPYPITSSLSSYGSLFR